MLYAKTLEEIPGPARIVFDLQEIEPLFHKRVAWMKDCEASLTEVMELLPAYINDGLSAADGLNALIDRVLEDHEQANAPQDGQIYAKAVRLVGQYMIDQYIHQGLYRDTGVCTYVFEGWLDPQSPVFVKTPFEELFIC